MVLAIIFASYTTKEIQARTNKLWEENIEYTTNKRNRRDTILLMRFGYNKYLHPALIPWFYNESSIQSRSIPLD